MVLEGFFSRCDALSFLWKNKAAPIGIDLQSLESAVCENWASAVFDSFFWTKMANVDDVQENKILIDILKGVIFSHDATRDAFGEAASPAAAIASLWKATVKAAKGLLGLLLPRPSGESIIINVRFVPARRL